MGDLKPLGSEKLQGDDKLKRILELAYYNNPKKPNTTTKAELVKESATGGVFGIVKEKDGYYVKKGLNESSLDYIGGLFMKNKNRFSSYAEAYKRLDLLSGQEKLQEATKYVLKQKKAEQEAPVPQPTMDTPPPAAAPATPDVSTPDMSNDTTSEPEVSGDQGSTENGKRSDYMAEIQKFAGKLGQALRDEHERLESDDIKYVINMVISAVDLNKLSDEDIEDLGKKFDRDDEEGAEGDGGMNDEPAEEPNQDSDLGETMNKLSEFIKSTAPKQEDEIDLSKYSDLGSVHEEDKTEEIDLDEIKNEINSRIGETLSKYFK